MIDSTVIIVGGGPAGSTCAWALQQKGVDVIILDKKEFPRPKLCAGWITPRVLRRLRLEPSYPHSLTRFNA
ncbi:FAD-dependent oxidoreductase, partial [candidate division KSB1 bacterium]